MTENRVKMTVFDKNYQRKGWIGNPVSYVFTPRFNAQGTGSIMLKQGDPILAHLLADGARIVCEYRGEHLMSGRQWGAEGGLLPNSAVTVQIRADWMDLGALAYVRPAGNVEAISLTDPAQASLNGSAVSGTVDNQGGYFPWPSTISTREAAIKHLIAVNLRDRLGVPVNIAASLGRGGAASNLPLLRMVPLTEALPPLLAAAGLGLHLRHLIGTTGLTADVWEPRVYARRLTARSGIIRGGAWRLTPPEATRALVAGPGEMAARAFLAVVDTTLETRYGVVLERARDATSGALEWGDLAESVQVAKYYLLRPEISATDKAAFLRQLTDAAADLLAETGPTSGLSMQLAETKTFHFGGPDGVHLGDQVTVRAQGIDFTDRISETSLVLSNNGDFKVTPMVGAVTDSPARNLALAIAALASAQRRSFIGR